MAKQLVNITATGETFIGTVMRPPNLTNWFATFFAYGTFGGTTINWQWSPDNGTTFLPMKDLTGNAVTSTTNDSFNSEFGTGKKNSDHITLWVNLVSGSGINVNVGFYDNQ
jgi:hypothetical protein